MVIYIYKNMWHPFWQPLINLFITHRPFIILSHKKPSSVRAFCISIHHLCFSPQAQKKNFIQELWRGQLKRRKQCQFKRALISSTLPPDSPGSWHENFPSHFPFCPLPLPPLCWGLSLSLSIHVHPPLLSLSPLQLGGAKSAGGICIQTSLGGRCTTLNLVPTFASKEGFPFRA